MYMDEFYNNYKLFYKEGYQMVYLPTHSRANTSGAVYVHILVAEKMLNRPLKDTEIVHHVDFNRSNNKETNIWVFKTGRDHSNYHSSLKYNLDFKLLRRNNVYECEIIENTINLICPKCGNTKSKKSLLCLSCTKSKYKLNSLTKETLMNLIEVYNFTEIGKLYGVSGNAIKKKCINFDIYIPKVHTLPEKESFIVNLNKYDTKELCEIYNVSKDILYSWILKYNIIILPKNRIQCVETNIIYSSSKDVIRKLYPLTNVDTESRKLRKVLNTNNTYKGLHWVSLNKEIVVT